MPCGNFEPADVDLSFSLPRNLTLLLFADSVHRIGLSTFCHEAKGRLDSGGFAAFAKQDVHGVALQCRWPQRALRIIYVSSFGVAPEPPYHYKFDNKFTQTYYYRLDNGSGHGQHSATAPTAALEASTPLRFAHALALLEAAGEAFVPDVVLVASALWDMARMEELGRGAGAVRRERMPAHASH